MDFRTGRKARALVQGPGTAWEMPFSRGLAEGKAREMLIALHETGRITRQEIVSMIPVLALQVSTGDYVLDMCASPGSKTTQISECLGEGVVFANEISNSGQNIGFQCSQARLEIFCDYQSRRQASSKYAKSWF